MGRKILLADDSVTIQKVVELTFSDGDYDVSCVGDGSLVVDRVRDIKPEILLLDVILPGENGYDVCEMIKKDPSLAGMPVLLLTGTFEPFDRRRAEAVGADGHLTKPFESQVLISRVKELLERKNRATVAREPESVPAPPLETVHPEVPEVPVEIEVRADTPEPSEPSAPLGALSDDDVDRIARRLAERIADNIVREVAWEVVPELAEHLVRERIRQIEEDAD